MGPLEKKEKGPAVATLLEKIYKCLRVPYERPI